MKCNTCESDSSELYFLNGNFRVVKCKNCGLVYLDNPMSKEEAKKHYDEFFKGQGSNVAESEYAKGRSFRLLEASKRLDVICSIMPMDRILDVGTGLGYFLYEAQNRGIQTVGVELSSVAADYARSLGLEVYQGDFLETDISERFSAVTFWASLEHMYDPKAALRKAAELLVPGGLLVVETGDIGSIQARIFGKHWRLFQDDHNFYYSSATLDEVLRIVGFKIIRTKHDGFVEGLVKQLGIWRASLSPVTSQLKQVVNEWAGKLGLGDVMIKYAVKLE